MARRLIRESGHDSGHEKIPRHGLARFPSLVEKLGRHQLVPVSPGLSNDEVIGEMKLPSIGEAHRERSRATSSP